MPHEYEIKNGQMLQKPKNISMRTAARYIEFVYHLDKYGGSASYSGLYGAEWMCEFAPFLPKLVDLEVFDGRVLDEISSDICFTKLCIACATMDGFSFRSLSGRRVQHLEMNYIGLDDFAHLISINGLKKLTLRMDEDFVGIPLEILLLEVKSLQILHFRDPPFWLTRQLVENFSVLNKTKLREIELSGFSFSVLNPFAVDQHFVNWELNVADDNDEWKLTWKPS
ncbi:hypothetical protein HDU82_004724 [Entophlyctis luteolus]|nr:hypothetical protein HDU82_004724 [Entophlyctis luteolus]